VLFCFNPKPGLSAPRSGAACFLRTCIGSVLAFIPTTAEARINLAQRAQVIAVRNEAVIAARDHFSVLRTEPELPPSLQQLLLDSLPEDNRDDCQNLMDGWGNTLSGTAVWHLRVLSQQPKQAWLAFRCGSSRPDLAKYCDERLALLRLDAATLEFLPFAPDAQDDPDLYHVESSQRLALKAGEAIAFRVSKSNDNIGIGGTEEVSEETMKVYVDTPRGAREVLSVLTRRDNGSSSDNPDIDTRTVYRGEVKFERDSNQQITAVTVTFHEEVTEVTYETGGVAKPHQKGQRSGTLRYRWNPTAFSFEEVK
jgi:hypothetical protein